MPPDTNRYAVFSLCLFLFASSCLAQSLTVEFQACDGSTDSSKQSMIWSSKIGDPSSSVISYSLCGLNAQDLRFITHLHLSHYEGGNKIIDRQFPVCGGSNERQQACMDAIARSSPGNPCLVGTLTARIPVVASNPSTGSRSEILVSEGARDVVMKFCSN